ncbi:SDR family NAD(P)-dependent oxidoreductase [Aspergillus neoniger CBS 115656]|uniref:Short-chain dehydrogenase n=1 Tax=Aspergillus neoniger (strain CBS 115656) TaxID=1448310 RepID=A0A318YBA5_ASPNB|nr:short-chain dehydrogenase [Aspergillus neoniger CBS 115656]PYH29623.1 short-chain dehydrogenase [Aspergillus neoniger CBS 115656]
MSLQLSNLFGVKDKSIAAIAEGFSTNGAKVYITGRRVEVLEKAAEELRGRATLGGQVIPIKGDVSTKDGCAQLVEQIKQKENHVDVLISNAGLPGKTDYPPWNPNDPDAVEKGLWESVDDESFTTTNNVNISGVYFTTVGFLPLLRKSSDPSVIVIASLAGLANQRTVGTVTYGASKAAGTLNCRSFVPSTLANSVSKLFTYRSSWLVDFLRIALPNDDISMKVRVNCICPGIFPSEMTFADTTGNAENLNPVSEGAAKRAPAGRPGYPEEIVGPCLMLSSKAGGYMTGGYLLVDGGRAMSASINDGIHMPEDTYVW